MTRLTDKQKALDLRKQEMSYSQIREKLGVSKSTLSNWLKDYPLSKQRIAILRDKNEHRIERYRETMQKKHTARLKKIYEEEKKNLLPLNDREIFIFGLGLYWGEGTKRQMRELTISNTDPNLIKFFIYWLEKNLKVSREKVKIQLHLYHDMNIDEEMIYWSKVLEIPISQFNHPYVKKTSTININHKRGFGHGTCNASINGVPLAEKILMGIKAIADITCE